MLRLLTVALGLSCIVGYAFAAPPPAPSPSAWAGMYLGINGGAAFGSLDWDYQVGGTADQWPTGGLAGVTAGFNWQRGSWVAGVEGDVDWAGISGMVPCPNPSFSCQSNIDWLGTFRGRLGWAGNRVLLYGTGGLAVGGVNIQTVLPGGAVPPSGTPTNGTSTTDVGWTAGFGSEIGLANNWSAKLEWLYYDLGTSTHTVDNNLKVNAAEAGSLVRLGFNRRF
jgi:outer membrane immunogenic protein